MTPVWGWLAVVVVSFLTVRLTIVAAQRLYLGIDPFRKVQGMHSRVTSRLGGIGVFVSFSVACAVLWMYGRMTGRAEIATFWLVSAPVFLVGLVEDLTMRVSARVRLLVTAAAAGLGMVALGAIVTRVNVPLIDRWMLSASVVSIGFTLFAVAGIPHALNIVDGVNGLASTTGLCGLLAVAAVAAHFHDGFLMTLGFAAAAAVTGFLMWNFPYGRIFLGDAGSYWLGFTLAELCVLLVARHPTVSSWFPMLLAIYPVWETLFSIGRRVRNGGFAAIARPDAKHMHHLVYRRLMLPRFRGNGPSGRLFANSATTVPFLLWSATAAFAGTLLADQPRALFSGCVLFALAYVLIYRYLGAYRPRRPAASQVRETSGILAGASTIAVSHHLARSHGDSAVTKPVPQALFAEAPVERAAQES